MQKISVEKYSVEKISVINFGGICKNVGGSRKHRYFQLKQKSLEFGLASQKKNTTCVFLAYSIVSQ